MLVPVALALSVPAGAQPVVDDVLHVAMTHAVAPEIAPGDKRLTGHAFDDKHRPVAGATITLDDRRTAISAADGSFAFDGVSHDGYLLAGRKGEMYGDAEYFLTDDDPAELTLREGPRVAIHVVGHDGRPVFYAKISNYTRFDKLTDPRGNAEILGTDLGTTRVSIEAPGYASTDAEFDVGQDPRVAIEKTIVLGPSAPIAGVVLDADGQPVPGARIHAERTDHMWLDVTTSDDRGHWSLTSFGAGEIELSASTERDIAAPAAPVVLDGTPRSDLVIRVERGATVSGVAVDRAGKPVAGVRVDAGGAAVDADKRGRFQLVGLEPGDLTLSATSDMLGSVAQTLPVPRGGHAEVRFVMVPSSIAGVVSNGHGKPVSKAMVFAHGPGSKFAPTDAHGRFDFKGLPPGDYQLSVTRADESIFKATPEVSVHTGDRNAALVVPDAASIVGRVVMDGKPVDYFGVALAGSGTAGSPDPIRALDGRFEEPDQRPGTFAVTIVGPGFQSRRIDDVVVREGGRVDLGDIAVHPGRRVRGRVVDGTGRPVANAAVVIEGGDSLDSSVEMHGELDGPRGVHTDAQGRFEIAGLADSYAQTDAHVQASSASGIALPRPLVDADFARGIELVLVPVGAVAGTKPAARDFVHVISLADGRETSAFGSEPTFSLDQLPAGDYIAAMDDVVAPPTVFHVDAGQTAHVALAEPTDFVQLDVALIGDCSTVALTAPEAPDPTNSNAWLATASCDGSSDALFPSVAPGRYRACQGTSCTTVDVKPSPSRQTVTLTVQPELPSDEDDE